MRWCVIPSHPTKLSQAVVVTLRDGFCALDAELEHFEVTPVVESTKNSKKRKYQNSKDLCSTKKTREISGSARLAPR